MSGRIHGALAFNLGVFLQGADLPEAMADRSLTSLHSIVLAHVRAAKGSKRLISKRNQAILA